MDVYAWPGGPFSYMWHFSPSSWTAYTRIDGSNMIANQYNNLILELKDTEFILTYNGEVICTFINEGITRIGEVFIGADARAGAVGSLHIDNVRIGSCEIDGLVDFNGDGLVDGGDVLVMANHWGENYAPCDIGPTLWGDGVVDIEDLKVLAEYIGEPVGDPTLIAHWAFDETEGMIAADSAGVNDGTVMGIPAWQPDGGKVGGALEFDGVGTPPRLW